MKLTFQKGDLLAVLLVLVIASAAGVAFWPGWRNAGAGQSAAGSGPSAWDSEQSASDFGQPASVSARAHVQVYQNGELLYEVPLDEDMILEVGGEYRNVIQIQDGRAAVTESDCPGGDCVGCGWIESVGRSIFCLPNRVEMRIVGDAEVDFVVG